MKELKLFDDPKNVRRLLWAFYLGLAVLILLDFAIHKHAEFSWETFPDFFALYGFLSYVGLIFFSKLMRLFLKRREDYYD